jgi:hypothetical protein
LPPWIAIGAPLRLMIGWPGRRCHDALAQYGALIAGDIVEALTYTLNGLKRRLR